MKFELPAELPVTVAELSKLREDAAAEITRIQTEFDNGGDLSSSDVAYLTSVLDAVDALNAAVATASADETAHRDAVSAAIERSRAAAAVETESEETTEAEPVEDAETDEAPALVAGADNRPVNFSGLGNNDAPETPKGPGWIVVPGAPGFAAAEVGTRTGFARMGKALDSVRKGHGAGRLTGRAAEGGRFRQGVGQMTRNLPEALDQHMLVDLINKATDQRNLPGGSLVAAGGWCAPSEQLYDFCDVPDATDLISLPEIGINRGGLRWPVEPDLTSLFESFEFFFTEPELEAVDGSGNPTAIKHCVEIPCPDEFEEIRLNAVGYCVEAGILQRQGWPESIEYVLRAITQEHFRSMSRRSIRDMWNGGNPVKVFDANLAVGATSGVLNALALYATNIRLHRGLGRTATIEGVAPSWFFEVLRADMAMQQGIDTKSVPDSQVVSWLTDRHIAFQYVGDWQTRDVDLPGHLDTLRWPGHVDIMLYPAGTWFRSLSNIIEVGVMYPKEQLQINRYTEFFTEDAIAIGKRCGISANLRIPLKVNGGYGAPVTINYTDTDPDFGGGFSGAAPGGGTDGQAGLPTTTNLSTTGTVTAGTFKLTYLDEETTALNWNATATQIKNALVALNDGLGADDFTVTGGPLPGTPVVIVARGGGKVSVTSASLTGGALVAA